MGNKDMEGYILSMQLFIAPIHTSPISSESANVEGLSYSVPTITDSSSFK